MHHAVPSFSVCICHHTTSPTLNHSVVLVPICGWHVRYGNDQNVGFLGGLGSNASRTFSRRLPTGTVDT